MVNQEDLGEKNMHDHLIILLERKGGREFARFMELFKKRAEIPIKDVRSKIANSSFYDFILNRIYVLNKTIENIDPKIANCLKKRLI